MKLHFWKKKSTCLRITLHTKLKTFNVHPQHYATVDNAQCHLISHNLSTLISHNPSTIVPFHKSQDTLLHSGLNDQIQNTLFTEDPHATRALWGWFDWLPGSACADLNWSALVNHIGIHPLPATQPTLIGHTLYIKPRPSQFSVPHVPPYMHGNGEIFVCNI